jgi:serine protease
MKPRVRLTGIMTVALVLAMSATRANSQLTYKQRVPKSQALAPRWVPDKPDKIVLDAHQAIAGVFVLKFVEGSHVRSGPKGLFLDPQAIVKHPSEMKRLSRAGLDPEKAVAQLAQVQTLLSDYGAEFGFKVDALFQPQGKNTQIDQQFAEKSKLEQAAGEELADFDLYYVVHAADFKEMAVEEQLMNELNALAIVEQVHPDIASSGAQVTADVSSSQGYLDPVPAGLDGRYIWSRPGGRGENVRFIDVEFDWVTDHEDFAPSSNLFWGGRPACVYDGNGSEHGTAVMGVVAARDNGIGVTGFAPNVRYGLSSVCRPFDYLAAGAIAAFSGENFAGRAHGVVVANAIYAAAGALNPGGIMLIEQHVPGPGTGRSCTCNCSQWEYVPIEYYQESFDAIRRATAAGVIVVEAAANGGQDLDQPLYGGRLNRAVRDSHALLVGASGAGDGMIACFSSSSRRIDVYAWGDGVTTLGYGNGAGAAPPFNTTAIPRHYTRGFGGTSSASAVVAGAVVSLQSARVGAGLSRLTPDQMRDLLVSAGTPQQDTPAVIGARPIGVQPDLRVAFQRSALPSSSGTDVLVGLNLFGHDYRSFRTLNDNGAQCSTTCNSEAQCRGWSWVKPGVQGPSAMCWLKDSLPAANNDSNTNSGISAGARIGQNLPGSDYRSFATANDGGGQCLATCLRDSDCRAWTWVRPGTQGPAARCWLKNAVPAFTADLSTNSNIVRP